MATAGHVDHGKSTLIQALTGTDPDRWAQEKERGLTIDLGFAFTTMGSGREVSFIDVPGHARFIANMLAGVGAVDACLFVVAATEGWKPQSQEHLAVLDLLGISHGLVALTKTGGLEPHQVDQARANLDDHLSESFLSGAEVIAVDAPAGLGITELADALDEMLASTPQAVDHHRPRLWVDRSFAAKGAGTVVTGTLTGGPLSTGQAVMVIGPGQPVGGRPARIRSLQTQGRPVEEIGPGHRVAVNLAGMEGRPIRGDALVRPDQWEASDTLDAGLRTLADLDHDVSRRGAYAAYLGSGEHPASIRVLGPDVIGPGEEHPVRLHLSCALPLLPGDRFVLRESGRAETVGGGEILDVAPVLRASKANPDRNPHRVVAERQWVSPAHLERLTGQRLAPNVAGRWIASPEAMAEAVDTITTGMERAGPLGLDVAGLDDRLRGVLADMAEAGQVTVNAGRARAPADKPVDEVHPYVHALEASAFSPPSPQEWGMDRALLRHLVVEGEVIEQDGLYFGPKAVARAALAVARLLADDPNGLTVSAIRDELGTSRKFMLALLAYFDSQGITRRRGDLRIGGPRLPKAGPGARV
ncbi:MAG: selenocysteine-specific translation elongation factor [Acidimicrobiales bacterium]